VATRAYVESEVSAVVEEIFNSSSQVQGNVEQVLADYQSNIGYVVNTTNANLNSVQSSLTTRLNALQTFTSDNFNAVNVTTRSLQDQTNAISAKLPLLASLDGPAFTGIPTVPTPPPGSNNAQIASTAYVDGSSQTLQSDYRSQISNLAASTSANLLTATSQLAAINSPAFTGVPSAPTPDQSNNSDRVATTAFVAGAIGGIKSTWQGSSYTVSTKPPSGGNPGDFWFQIG